MLTKMRNTLKLTRQQLYTITMSRLPIVNATELTKSSWAKPIKSYDDVPNVYKDFFETSLADVSVFPYTILAPSNERFIHKTNEKLICDFGDEIYVLERRGNAYGVQCYPFEGINYVESRTMLLDSYIRISGVTRRGALDSSTIKFNSISDYLFTPIQERIRLATFDTKSATQGSELEKFDYLVRLNYKFMNYAKRSLLGGEKVIHAVLQPEIRASLWTVMGMTYYWTIFPTHMCILTDQELIMIRENEGRGGKDKYGGIWDYIPLNKIVALSLSEKDRNLLVLSIQLPEGESLEVLFRDSLRREADQLLVRFRELTKIETVA